MGLFDFLKKKDAIPYAKIGEELDIFTKESLAMPKMNNPFLLEDKSKHPMIFGYFVGAMDYIAQAYQLNKRDKSEIYTQYLARHFADNDAEQTKELLKYSTTISQTDDGSHYILVGGHAMKKWVAGGPMAKYAPMGLIRLLND
ncbi:MAG: hypothetical protein OQK45_04665 [Sulfurovum sp.]|nr:hypothetical protein [Sulfurovum sp.]